MCRPSIISLLKHIRAFSPLVNPGWASTLAFQSARYCRKSFSSHWKKHNFTIAITTGSTTLKKSLEAYSQALIVRASIWTQGLGLACLVFLVFQACSFLPTAILIQHFSYAVLDETYGYPFLTCIWINRTCHGGIKKYFKPLSIHKTASISFRNVSQHSCSLRKTTKKRHHLLLH